MSEKERLETNEEKAERREEARQRWRSPCCNAPCQVNTDGTVICQICGNDCD